MIGRKVATNFCFAGGFGENYFRETQPFIAATQPKLTLSNVTCCHFDLSAKVLFSVVLVNIVVRFTFKIFYVICIKVMNKNGFGIQQTRNLELQK